jgi:hypothetical protein
LSIVPDIQHSTDGTIKVDEITTWSTVRIKKKLMKAVEFFVTCVVRVEQIH